MFFFGEIMADSSKTNSPIEKLELVLEIPKPVINRFEKSFDLLIKLHNHSESDLNLVTIENKQPFSISIWNDKGVNLNSQENKKGSKDRTQKEKRTTIAKKSSLKYKVNFEIKDVLKEDIVNRELNEFKVEIIFPAIQFINGNYVSSLKHSNRAKVSVVDK